MQKRRARWILLMMISLLLGIGFLGFSMESTYAEESDLVRLKIDGNLVATDVAPVIQDSRTLVPARAVFEAMGGVVTWNDAVQEVGVTLGTNSVRLIIGKTDAYVNNVRKELDVPAAILNDRTMIPVRFVAQGIGSIVDWDNESRTVLIQSPVKLVRSEIQSITIKETAKTWRIQVNGDQKLQDYHGFALEGPERYVVDLKDADLGDLAGLSNEARAISGIEGIFSKIRYSQFEPGTVRLVMDLDQKALGTISFSEDQTSLYIDFDKSIADMGSEDQQTPAIGTDGEQNEENNGLPLLDWRASEKLVVIDPGHGGLDSGCIAYQNGAEVLYEEDVNLDVALRLNQYLEDAGVKTYLIREADVAVVLADRPAMANLLRADLMVSVHNNSYEPNPSANGTEVYYSDKDKDTAPYGITSQRLAELLLKELVPALGTADRGIRRGDTLAVIRRSEMPAVIIEGAYFSNANDILIVLTEAYRENYAKAAAIAIIKALNESID